MPKGVFKPSDFVKTADKIRLPEDVSQANLSPVDLGKDFVKSTDTVPVLRVNDNWKTHGEG